MQDLKTRYLAVKSAVADAAVASGRQAEDVELIAAVKYATAEEIEFLHRECGLCHVGENRVQQLLEHYEALPCRDEMKIHFIGSLQKNKVKYIIDKVCLIHSLDSLSLAAEIEKQAAKRGITMDVLVEINSGKEESKGGVMPEDAAEFCLALSEFPHVRLRGFMTMAPKCEKKEEYFNYFQETSQLVLDIWQEKLHNIYKPVLSMGMSASVIPAIEAGADCVRVGSAIFGRTTPLK
jgi:pyridoxal phosphate enzyme (YggS family)